MMKIRRIALGLLCVAALLLTACAPVGEQLTTQMTEPQPAPLPTVDGVIAELCSPTYAGRAVGSAGNEAAADYIAGLFEAMGLAPFFETYDQPYEDFVVYPERAEAKLAILSADGARTELTVGKDFRFAPPTADIDVALPVLTDQPLCAGGAAFFYGENVGDATKFIRESADNLAVICVALDGRPSMFERDDERGTYLTIDERHRAVLTAEGATLELSIRACAARGTARNVVSVLRGSEGKNALIVGAHFDGSGQSGEVLFPSAYDNASGTAAMLETARLLATSGVMLKNDVIFAAFNGEESGMDGSKALAAELIGRYEQINVINIDCVGLRGSAGLAVFDEDGSAAQLQGALLGQLSGAEAKVDYPSDQRSFSVSGGVQAVALADRDCLESGLFHTANDTSDRLDGEAITAAASGVAALLRADVVYTAPHPKAQQPRDGLTDAQRTVLHRLYEDGTVSAFGQMYINAEISPGKYEVVTGGSLLLHSAEEVRQVCANLVLPESIGEYAFLAAQISAKMDTDAWGGFMSLHGAYEVGKVYDCSDKLRGTYVNAFYAASDGRLINIIIIAISEAVANLEGIIEGPKIDPALAGYWIADIYPQADGYDTLYYEDARGVRAAIGSYSSDEALLAAMRAPGATPNAINSLAGYRNIMTKEDLIALAQSCDMPALTAMIEPRKQ